MIEHVSLPVRNYKKSKAFYTAALKPLGYKVRYELGKACGYMEGGHTSIWIAEDKVGNKLHVAFRAKGKKAVHDFYDAALKAGAKDNGAPGPRPDYSPDYYAAFVLDPDGHNIEAVCYLPAGRHGVQPRRASKKRS
jgi:catechol 2,3-dioxygenase-like lactoylglutathione lyase family enzyme